MATSLSSSLVGCDLNGAQRRPFHPTAPTRIRCDALRAGTLVAMVDCVPGFAYTCGLCRLVTLTRTRGSPGSLRGAVVPADDYVERRPLYVVQCQPLPDVDTTSPNILRATTDCEHCAGLRMGIDGGTPTTTCGVPPLNFLKVTDIVAANVTHKRRRGVWRYSTLSPAIPARDFEPTCCGMPLCRLQLLSGQFALHHRPTIPQELLGDARIKPRVRRTFFIHGRRHNDATCGGQAAWTDAEHGRRGAFSTTIVSPPYLTR